jgi:hypothetical protein
MCTKLIRLPGQFQITGKQVFIDKHAPGQRVPGVDILKMTKIITFNGANRAKAPLRKTTREKHL